MTEEVDRNEESEVQEAATPHLREFYSLSLCFMVPGKVVDADGFVYSSIDEIADTMLAAAYEATPQEEDTSSEEVKQQIVARASHCMPLFFYVAKVVPRTVGVEECLSVVGTLTEVLSEGDCPEPEFAGKGEALIGWVKQGMELLNIPKDICVADEDSVVVLGYDDVLAIMKKLREKVAAL